MLDVGPIMAMPYKKLQRKILLKKEVSKRVAKKNGMSLLAKKKNAPKKIITKLVRPDKKE